jgi:XTP/dITP diphosphohydrolase
MRTVNQIVLASTNDHKYLELKALLARTPGIELISPVGLLRNADKIGIVETHSTYLENAAAKARLVNQGCHYPALADDSGLEVLFLEGQPGVRSARDWNVDKVLAALKGQGNREARFVTTLALVIEGTLLHATGVLEGVLTESPRGANGFGYDPIFVPKGETRTLAEMTETEKNAISHRARALEGLFRECQVHGIQWVKP